MEKSNEEAVRPGEDGIGLTDRVVRKYLKLKRPLEADD